MSPLARGRLVWSTLACLPALAVAQTPASSVQRIEVIASPIVESQRTDSFGALATEVGAAQVRDLDATDLSAALRRTPGVTVSRFNPVGAFGGDEGGAVHVRGLGASRPGSEVKTYVDGLPFYMGVWNHALLDLLPVGGMERVSVFKGPQPQHFGNTFAAIDLTPRHARTAGLSPTVRVAGGSFSTLVEQAELGVASSDGDLSIVQGHARSNGHRAAADGRLDNLMASGRLRLSPQWQVGFLALGADNDVSDPGVEGDPSSRTGTFATRGALVGASLAHDHGRVRGRLQLYANQGTGHWDNPTAAVVHSRFRMSGLRWRESAEPWVGGELALGLDVDRLSGSVAFNGFTAFDGETLRLTSPHAALAQRVALGGGWTATPSAGVRLYRHNVYGSSSAPHAGVVLAHDDRIAYRLHLARGLNHPGLDAGLLNAIVPPLAGAPTSWRTLKPERMDHAELGVAWRPSARSKLDLAVFEDRLKDRYVFAFPPVVTVPSLTNLGAYRIRGAELSWQHAWSSAWSGYGGLTLLDPSLDDLPYAPRRALAAGIAWQGAPWRVSADLQSQSRMFTLNRARADGAANTAAVAGFAVLGLRVAHRLSAGGLGGEVFVAVENLGDTRYAYRPGYPMPGRSAQVGIEVRL